MLETIIAYTDSNRLPVICLSSISCGLIFGLILIRTQDKRVASEITSIAHHVLVVALALLTIYENWERILKDSALSLSQRFYLVNTIQRINIGYFVYDSVNAVVWEHNFIIHHAVALLGFGISDFSGRGGLGNSVNTLIAEIGSIAYNFYNKNKSPRNYVVFVVAYTSTRIVFMIWTWIVLKQLCGMDSYERNLLLLRCFISVFQTLLVIVNLHFLSVHLRKLRRVISVMKKQE